MQSAPHRQSEAASLAALRKLAVLDTGPEPEFDALAQLAAIVCDMPTALISLIDADRQWFKAHVNLPGATETARDLSFCAHAVLGDEVFEVADALLDDRFYDNPLVTGAPGIRHYAGAPLRLDGLCIGTICVIGTTPGRLTAQQTVSLKLLAIAIVSALQSRQAMLDARQGGTPTQDALTGLVNRAEFEQCLHRALAATHANGAVHALLFIDLDQFRLVNDACGHGAGDRMLQEVASRLVRVVRVTDTLARIGGDEFAVIMNNCSAEQAQRVAQKICDAMDDFRFSHQGQRFRIGTSIGLVPVDRHWTNTAAILQAAEASCSAASEAGGNRVHTWCDSDQLIHLRHGEMQWATRVEQALDEDRFVLFAQRIEGIRVPAAGVHAEVLIRMIDGDGALVPPGAFLPAAERFHLATRIDRWVLKRTIAWMKKAPSLDRIKKLSVNLSGQSVGDRSFQGWAIGVLADAGDLLCQRLCFEITETAAVANMTEAASFMAQLRSIGVRVALDDFGAGASSFGYLKNLRVDYLKIDGQFIRGMLDDPLNDATVRCFAEVARVVGMKTVAEFVDQPAILERLGEIGIDYAQGYLLHKPAPIDELFDPFTATPPAAAQALMV